MSKAAEDHSASSSESVVLAAIDIGTNTLKFTVARCFPDGRIETLDERNDAVRIGAGIEMTGCIDAARLDRAVRTLVAFEAAARELGARRFVGVATEALRVASNGHVFLDRVREETSWEIQTISGEDEARLTFLGLRSHLPEAGPSAIVDIGGGSTEIITAAAREIEAAWSISIGSGRLADRWFHADPPGVDSIRKAEADASTFLESNAPGLARRGGTLLLSGGNGQYIEALREHYRLGDVLDEPAIVEVLARLAVERAEAVAEILGIQQERASVLPAGVAIARVVAGAVQPVRIAGVPSGIRLGLLREVIERDGPGPPHR